jgi:U11/U12 small nuclear ribonucleoprotein SNRNP65
MNAIIGVPKLYTQVLHLMNKMNLPCPFGPVTSTPPLVSYKKNARIL